MPSPPLSSDKDPHALIRESLQARLLARLFSQKLHGFVLKGGLAMRAHFKSVRATKDIDLDVQKNLSLSQVKTLLRRAIAQATSDGMMTDVTVTEPKQTETVARWKIGARDPGTQTVVHLTVELSFRDHIQENDLTDISHFVAGDARPHPITVYTGSAMAFHKVRALMGRDTVRDIADLFVLVQAQVDPPIAHLGQWMAEHPMDLKDRLKLLWDKIEGMNAAQFEAKVLPSLPQDAPLTQQLQDWESVRLAVGLQVQDWLTQAQVRCDALNAPPLPPAEDESVVARPKPRGPR